MVLWVVIVDGFYVFVKIGYLVINEVIFSFNCCEVILLLFFFDIVFVLCLFGCIDVDGWVGMVIFDIEGFYFDLFWLDEDIDIIFVLLFWLIEVMVDFY